MAFILHSLQSLGLRDYAILLYTRPQQKYVNGSRLDETEGTIYEVLAFPNSLEKPQILMVKVPHMQPIIQQAVITEHNEKRNFIEVSFENFQAKPYTDKNGHMSFSCKADNVVIETDVTIDY